MDKRLFAKELFKFAFAISVTKGAIKNMVDNVATPGSEIHSVLENIIEAKLNGAQKIHSSGMECFWI